MAATILGLVALCCVGDLPSVQEMAASRQDVWGEAAVHQPGGPSYEVYKDPLPLSVAAGAVRDGQGRGLILKLVACSAVLHARRRILGAHQIVH